MSTTRGDNDDTEVKAQILRKYPHEPSNITLSPVRRRSRGKVNDEDVDFCYRLERRDYHHTGALYDCLSWKKLHSNDADDLVTIGVKYIVGVHTVGGRASNRYSLIFVDLVESSNESPTPTLGLQTATIVDPPEDLVSDFLCLEEPEHLFVEPTSSTPNLHIVLSSGTGTGLASSVWRNLLQPLLKHFSLLQDINYTLHHTISRNTITDLTTSTLLPCATQGIAQTIILLSGGGGVFDLLNGLLSTHPPTSTETQSTNTSPALGSYGYVKPILALLPCGTSNALAHSSFLTSNRITRHSTLGLRALLLGTPSPLPFFRTTFSPGARLVTNQAQDRVPLRCLHRSDNSDEQGEGINEATLTLHGAVVASWALHATLVANSHRAIHRTHGSKRFQLAAEEALYPEDNDGVPHAYRGKVTLFDAARRLPVQNGTFMCNTVNSRELVRREHAYVLATCCAFLEERFEISPGHNTSGETLMAVEFGPLIAPAAERRGGGNDSRDGDAAAETGERGAADTRPGDEIMRVMQAAYNGGKHVRDMRVGYYSIGGMRIEIDDTEEDEQWRRFCVDGKIVVVEKGGWMEVRALDRYREGVLDLVGMEWEDSELSVGEEERLQCTGTLSCQMEPRNFGGRWRPPVDEVR